MVTIPTMGLLEGESGLLLVREVLESAIESTTASAVLFDALEVDPSEHLPRSVDELFAFVRGPLRLVVGRRMKDGDPDQVIADIEAAIQSTLEGRPPRSLAGGATLEIHVGTGPVRVLVLSKSSGVAIRLRASLGGLQINVANAATPEEAAEVAGALDPEVVVIDALAPVGGVDEILDYVQTLPATTTTLLWGEEQPIGRQIELRAVERRVNLTTVERAEGVDPVLDVIRSRHR
ncbi:MAG: hypothetical protein DRJ42_27975 [Deltaproteobacteria bacterium]|nr:MAG: hypothetical protein DRJ42_27975 [Deltaproteobacteria bacterium]